MQRERLRSRGNVAVAALMFVMLVGVAAVSLDSIRVNPRVLVAEVGNYDQRGYGDTKQDQEKRDCKPGYDYIIRVEKPQTGKTQSEEKKLISPTLHPYNTKKVTEAEANQCIKGLDTTPPTTSSYDTSRMCSKTWSCKIWICRPKGALTQNELKDWGPENDKSGELCSLLGQCGAGQPCDMSKKSAEDFKSRIERILRDPNASAAEQRFAKEYLPSLDKETQKGVLGAFDEDRLKAKTELEDATKDLNIARKKLEEQGCLTWSNPIAKYTTDYVSSCGQLRTEVARAEELEREKKRQYENLAKQAEALGPLKKQLEPKNIYNCPGGPDCDGGKWDPTKQQLVGGVDCTQAVNQANPKCSTFKSPPDPGPRDPGGDRTSSSNSGGGMGDIMKTLGQFAPLIGQLLNGALGGQKPPTCTLKASPTNITRPGQPVTISWTSQNAQQAYLSASGQVGPTGQMTVNPQQTTSYTMQVTGYPQQQAQQQQQQQQPQGQFVYNPYTGQYQFVQAQQQQQQPYGQGAPQQGQCQVQVTVGQNSGGGGDGVDKPKAQISCQPKIADVGMSVSISYACQNATTSKGEGFSTGDKLSGSASADVKSPEKGSTTVKYGLTCTKDGATDSAECTVNVNKPSIVLVANPKNIERREKTTIGWVTGAMESCVVSSPDLTEFTEANKNNTSTSGSAKTPPLEKNTKFVLTCTTKAGGTKTAETTVEVD